MISNTLKSAAALCLVLASPAAADWSANLISLGADSPGASGQITCPANGSYGTVWGSGTYTSDSSICTAAAHYGWINRGAGGVVSYRQVPGLSSYSGSSQNGVTTLDYGSWGSSFQITAATPLNAGSLISWSESADTLGIGSNVGQSHSFYCPPNGGAGGTAGATDIYTSDSAVCEAAVHRGTISRGGGGTVNVLVLGEQGAYAGSNRNGVNSSNYGAWPRSYVFQ